MKSLKCVFPLLEQQSPFISKLQRATEKFKKALLNIEIKHTYYKIKVFRQEMARTLLEMTNRADTNVVNQFVKTQDQSYDARTKTQESRTGSKLRRLLDRFAQSKKAVPTKN